MQFGIVFAAFISYQLTTPEISPIGRMAGGLAVWVFSIVDANGIAKRRVHAWARIQAGQAGRPGNGVAKSKDARARMPPRASIERLPTRAPRAARGRTVRAPPPAARVCRPGPAPSAVAKSPAPVDGSLPTLASPEPQGG